MRYKKPVIIDLSAGARSVKGQQVVPTGCHSGGAAGSPSEQCAAGAIADWTGPVCETGSSPDQGDCLGGAGAYYCESGSSGPSDPDGCRTGPYV